MASRRFCDLCDKPIQPEDDLPFVRIYTPNVGGLNGPKAIGHVMIMNEQNHVLTDVCNGCKLMVVNDGKPHNGLLNPPVATLRQPVKMPDPVLSTTPPPVLPFTLSKPSPTAGNDTAGDTFTT